MDITDEDLIVHKYLKEFRMKTLPGLKHSRLYLYYLLWGCSLLEWQSFIGGDTVFSLGSVILL